MIWRMRQLLSCRMATFGGADGPGAIFRVSTSGKQTVLHSFTGPDGADIFNGLLRDADGNLYGTATEGGAHGQGTVFKLSQ